MAARKVPLHRAWTPEKVRQRIRTSLLINRLEKQALAELGNEKMDALQQDAAKYLVSLLIPKAEAPRQLDVNANVNFTVVTGIPDG